MSWLYEPAAPAQQLAGGASPTGSGAVTLQPVERTLTDAEIEAVSDKIVAAVAKATGAVLRG